MLENMNKWATPQKVLFSLLLLIIVIAIFTPKSNNNLLSAGLGVHGHLGNLKGNFNVETMRSKKHNNMENMNHNMENMNHNMENMNHNMENMHHNMENMHCNSNNIESMTGSMNNSSPEVVLFYAPWCGHCKRMMPEWDSLGSSVGNVNVKKINSDENSELVSKHGVQGFPTIMYFKNGMDSGNGEGYEGERNATSLRNWISAKGTLAMGPNHGNSANVGYQGVI